MTKTDLIAQVAANTEMSKKNADRTSLIPLINAISTLRAAIAASPAAADSASRWLRRCYVPTTTCRATRESCSVV